MPSAWFSPVQRVGWPWMSSCCKDKCQAPNKASKGVDTHKPKVGESSTTNNQAP